VETGRLEAFSDGVIAVIITIMVIELKAPHGIEPAALVPLVPTFLAYVLSFVYVGIYWNNHHHLFAITRRVDGRAMLANLHLLFWLSLIPFTTGWVGEHHDAALPTALYGSVLLLAALAYSLLVRALMAANRAEPALGEAIGRDRKGLVSLAGYALGIGLALVRPVAADVMFAIVALVWLAPDRRIERYVATREEQRRPGT